SIWRAWMRSIALIVAARRSGEDQGPVGAPVVPVFGALYPLQSGTMYPERQVVRPCQRFLNSLTNLLSFSWFCVTVSCCLIVAFTCDRGRLTAGFVLLTSKM